MTWFEQGDPMASWHSWSLSEITFNGMQYCTMTYSEQIDEITGENKLQLYNNAT